MTTCLYLIRHGESEWNHCGKYTGRQDISLSALGRQQAEQIAHRLSGERIAAIYSSPLKRAQETAAPLARAHGLPVQLEPGLAEIHHGDWEGLTTSEVVERFPDEYAQWQTEPHRVQMPAGESLDDVTRRSWAAFERIVAEQSGQTVVLSSHDAVIRVLLLQALGLPLAHFWKWRLENASLSMIESQAGPHLFRLALLNDTMHLRNLRAALEKQAL
ncbi:MAG: alpha-ribazole phosphatase [Anaerolineae bacterium]